MVAASILSTFLLAFAVAANPVERRATLSQLSFTKHVSQGDLLKLDRLRVDILKRVIGNTFGPGISSPAENRGVTYIASVGVGSPPTNCK